MTTCCNCPAEATGLDWQKKPWCRPCWEASMVVAHRFADAFTDRSTAPLPARPSGRFGPEEEQHYRPLAAVDRHGVPAPVTKPSFCGSFPERNKPDARMAQGRARSMAIVEAKRAAEPARRDQLRARLVAAKQALAARRGNP